MYPRLSARAAAKHPGGGHECAEQRHGQAQCLKLALWKAVLPGGLELMEGCRRAAASLSRSRCCPGLLRLSSPAADALRQRRTYRRAYVSLARKAAAQDQPEEEEEERKHRFTLVLIRHGESSWNHDKRFQGWYDCPLSERGVEEAVAGGKLLKEAGFSFDVGYTSMLQRAIKTLYLVLDELNLLWIPVHTSWRLNERHYGALTGHSKKATVAKYGVEQVKVWRRGYDVPPPPLDESSEYFPGHDQRYAHVARQLLPRTESLKDTERRFFHDWEAVIKPAVLTGQRVIIAGHGNMLRVLVKHLDGISDRDIVELNLPTGVPLVYHLDQHLRPIAHPLALRPMQGYYLGDRDEVEVRRKKNLSFEVSAN